MWTSAISSTASPWAQAAPSCARKTAAKPGSASTKICGSGFMRSRLPTSTRGYAVGARGVILRTDDGGANWKDVESGISTNLFAVALGGRDDVLVAGEQGRIIHIERRRRNLADSTDHHQRAALFRRLSRRLQYLGRRPRRRNSSSYGSDCHRQHSDSAAAARASRRPAKTTTTKRANSGSTMATSHAPCRLIRNQRALKDSNQGKAVRHPGSRELMCLLLFSHCPLLLDYR